MWFLKRVVKMVRADRMTDPDLMRALLVQKDHHVLTAVREIGRRLELSVLEEAFDGTPEQRLRNLARVEGARELAALVEEWRDKAEKAGRNGGGK